MLLATRLPFLPACLSRIVATNKDGKSSPPETVGTITTASAPGATAVPL